MIRALVMTLVCSVSAAIYASEAKTHPRPHAETLARACSGCHGNEESRNSPVPSLHRMPRAALVQAMRDFKSGKRESSIMNRIANGYEDGDFEAMAAYFAQAGH